MISNLRRIQNCDQKGHAGGLENEEMREGGNHAARLEKFNQLLRDLIGLQEFPSMNWGWVE